MQFGISSNDGRATKEKWGSALIIGVKSDSIQYPLLVDQIRIKK